MKTIKYKLTRVKKLYNTFKNHNENILFHSTTANRNF